MIPGIGDSIAIADKCVELADYIQDIRNAPAEFQAAVVTLKSLHEMFRYLSQAVDGDFDPRMAVLDYISSSSREILASEIRRANATLANSTELLKNRYADAPSGYRSGIVKTAMRQMRWRSTRRQFQKQHEILHQCLFCVNTLLAAVQLESSVQSRAIGLPGSGGTREDHVEFEFGLGKSATIPLNLCDSSEVFQGFLDVMFARYPGQQHVQRGHYRLYYERFHLPEQLTEQNWPHYVKAGSSISLAFVVGTWQMSCLNWCPGCNSSQRGHWNAWRFCGCGLRYYVTETGNTDYEPVDGFWCGEKTRTLENWTASGFIGPAKAPEHSGGGVHDQSTAEPPEEQQDENDDGETRDDQAYFQNMVMVWDPPYNFVCRNAFCRCILGCVSFTSQAEKREILSEVPCPTHTQPGVRLSRHVCKLINHDYHKDPYFEQFGGYAQFLRGARYLSQRSVAWIFVDADKLGSDDLENDQPIPDLNDGCWRQYRAEVLPRLAIFFEATLKKYYEHFSPAVVDYLQEWVTEEQTALDDLLSTEGEQRKLNNGMYDLLPGLLPKLSYGRITIEVLENIMADDDCVIAL